MSKLEKLNPDLALESKEAYREHLWLWDAMIKGGAVPKTETPMTCIAKASLGSQFDLSPIIAVNSIYFVEGRPCMAAALMQGHVRRKVPQARIYKMEHDATRCVVKCKRDPSDEVWHVCEYTIEDAERAGLTRKANWKSHPKQMLYWRAVSMLCRELFSDVLFGVVHTPEELEAAPTVHQQESANAAEDDLFSEPPPTETIDDAEVVETPEHPTMPDYTDALELALATYRLTCEETGSPDHADEICRQTVGTTLDRPMTEHQQDAVAKELVLATDVLRKPKPDPDWTDTDAIGGPDE